MTDDIACRKCGKTNWKMDGRFGGLRCENCGWMPPKDRRDEIKAVIA